MVLPLNGKGRQKSEVAPDTERLRLGKRAVGLPRVMTLWEVGIEGALGRWELLGPTVEALRLKAFTIRFPGPNVALVDASDEELAPLRSLRGVEYVRRATDNQLYYDDRTRAKLTVIRDGTSFLRHRY